MPLDPTKRSTAKPLRPVAMVSLDGGGVRGLSSLLILRDLLVRVTNELIDSGVIPEDHATVQPQDVFDVATGTSTGGLIVLMLVKMDMSIDECMQQYKELSEVIFSKQRPLLKRIFGSDWSKYSGRRLQRAVEDLLKSRDHSMGLMMQSGRRKNTMKGTVLCHEVQQPHSIFFCTEECQGPYQQHRLQYDLEVRHAARATSAAPSFFKEMRIQERIFVDGGFGETNNPSWESRVHYHRNHDVVSARQLVMINIGTGTLPHDVDVVRLQKRPWWTNLIPKGLLKALGLVSDLVTMATDSEKPAERLQYMSEDHPEQLFFKRFSANTGIHNIKLDDWKAVTGIDGVGIIEERTQAYLENKMVQDELQQAAKKLAEVYAKRQEFNEMPSRASSEKEESIDLSISVVIGEDAPAYANLPGRTEAQYSEEGAVDAIPGLVTTSETTQSLGPSPPRTPELGSIPPPSQLELATNNKEILQSQGQQFREVLPSSSLLSATARSPPRVIRRAATLPNSVHSSRKRGL